MPKMKTKSGAKKRFILTGSNAVKYKQSHTRHMMRHRSQKMKRNARGMDILNESDTGLVMNWLPYGRKGA